MIDLYKRSLLTILLLGLRKSRHCCLERRCTLIRLKQQEIAGCATLKTKLAKAALGFILSGSGPMELEIVV